jgi:hypothetical protein
VLTLDLWEGAADVLVNIFPTLPLLLYMNIDALPVVTRPRRPAPNAGTARFLKLRLSGRLKPAPTADTLAEIVMRNHVNPVMLRAIILLTGCIEIIVISTTTVVLILGDQRSNRFIRHILAATESL